MDKVIQEKLRLIRKTAVFNNTLYSYVSTIAEIFLANPSKLVETCDTLGLTEDELIDILKSPTFSNIALLDEVVDISMTKIEEKTTVRGR